MTLVDPTSDNFLKKLISFKKSSQILHAKALAADDNELYKCL